MIRKYILLLLLPLSIFASQEEPLSIWLTWQQDPTTTMTVQWLTKEDDTNNDLLYRAIGDEKWFSAQGTNVKLPDNFKELVHRVQLINLKPNTGYEFSFSNYKDLHLFRTMPNNLTTPVRFIVGGDMYAGSLDDLKKTNRAAAKTDPDFVLIGGDIAYSSSSLWFVKEDGKRWIDWLKAWSEEMVTPDGFLIPIVPVIGNHEVNGRFGQTPNQAKFFYTIFPMPDNHSYRALNFKQYLTLILLDSNHTASIDGEQQLWLQKTLDERKNFTHKFAAYHVPAYPSIRKEKYKYSTLIRKYWVPLFDENNLNIAFEHHDHSYKRSYKLRGNKIDQTGTLYLGDGAWSPDHLRSRNRPAWYIKKQVAKRHFIVVYISENERQIFAVSDEGNLIDSYRETLNN